MVNLPGSGTSADPYQISDGADFNEIEKDMTAVYEIVNDIDASDTLVSNAGTFSGEIIGNDHVVTGFTPESSDYSSTIHDAMLETVSGSVHNIVFESPQLDPDSVAFDYLITVLVDGGSVSNITLRNGSINSDEAFGIIGEAQNDASLTNIQIENFDYVDSSGGRSIGLVCKEFLSGTMSDVRLEDVTIEAESGGAVFEMAESTVENVLLKNVEFTGTGDFCALLGRGADGRTVKNITVTGCSLIDQNGSNIRYGILAARTFNGTFENVLVYNNPRIDWRDNDGGQGEYGNPLIGMDEFDSDYTTSGLYYDDSTDQWAASDTVASGQATADLQGSTAETTLSEFDFTSTWAVITADKDGADDYPRLTAFYDAPLSAVITLNSPDEAANFVSGEQFAFDFQVSNNEDSLDATVNLNVNDPDGTSSNPISQSLTAGSSQTYNSSYTSSTLGSGSWEVVADAEGRSPVSESRVFEIFDESELSFDVDATDLSRVFFDAEIVGSDQVSYTVFVNGTERFSSDLSPTEHGVKTRSVDVSAETGATTVAVRVETGQNSTGSGLEVFNIRTDQVI